MGQPFSVRVVAENPRVWLVVPDAFLAQKLKEACQRRGLTVVEKPKEGVEYLIDATPQGVELDEAKRLGARLIRVIFDPQKTRTASERRRLEEGGVDWRLVVAYFSPEAMDVPSLVETILEACFTPPINKRIFEVAPSFGLSSEVEMVPSRLEETPLVIEEVIGEEQKPDVLLEKTKVEERKDNQGEKKETKKKKRRIWHFLLGSGVLLTIGWLSFPFWRLLWAGWLIYQGGVSLKNYRWQLAETKFASAQQVLSGAQPTWLVHEGKRWLRLGKLTAKVGQQANCLLAGILGKEQKEIISCLGELSESLKTLSWELSLTEAVLSRPPILLPRLRPFFEKVKGNLREAKRLTLQASEIVHWLPWLTGLGGERRTYLVLLQNSAELRPTGGFIGSFALARFEDGRLIEFEVFDVYSADGQLKGHVEPPAVIKEVLGEANWYLRDSNWDPNFPRSARVAAWFLQKELGEVVDGVVGVNLFAAQKLVAALGEVWVPDFEEKITADNLFARAEFWSENRFFPGSRQKADFLAALSRQLWQNIKQASFGELVPIGTALWQALNEKEILIFVKNKEIQADLAKFNWDGGLRFPACLTTSCLADYLFLVEANLGVNKVNWFLRRNAQLWLNWDGKVLNHKLLLAWENTAKSGAWPGGNYVNFLRIYLPSQTKVESIFLVDPQTGTRKAISPQDWRTELKGEFQVVGILIRVPINSRRLVEVNWQTKASPIGENWRYLLTWQKQSGYGTTPLTIYFTLPGGWQPLQVTPTAVVQNTQLIWSGELTHDWQIGVEFGR